MREAIRRHLAQLRFEQLRRRVMPFAEARGYLTGMFSIRCRESPSRHQRPRERVWYAGAYAPTCCG